uniref:S100/CaBP-9k-type calcium binding subdomain domain-containing protein n=1 Tax=Periophthalmus magnuspinnatus TaxID=409849 RepID=A0A3B4ALU7_9GOBI
MSPQYSELELALNTLVSEFHKASDNKATMNTTQFQTLLSNQMPALSKTLESDDGMGKLLQKMGVQSGQEVSFENFWSLINSQATTLFDATPKEKGVNCTCEVM